MDRFVSFNFRVGFANSRLSGRFYLCWILHSHWLSSAGSCWLGHRLSSGCPTCLLPGWPSSPSLRKYPAGSKRKRNKVGNLDWALLVFRLDFFFFNFHFLQPRTCPCFPSFWQLLLVSHSQQATREAIPCFLAQKDRNERIKEKPCQMSPSPQALCSNLLRMHYLRTVKQPGQPSHHGDALGTASPPALPLQTWVHTDTQTHTYTHAHTHTHRYTQHTQTILSDTHIEA